MLNTVVHARFQDALKTLDPESVQLTFCSPPYENTITYRDADGTVVSRGASEREYVNEFWTGLFDCLEPVMRKDGIVGIVVNNVQKGGVKSIMNYRGVIEVCDREWNLIEEVAWVKTSACPRKPARLQDWWEHIWLFSKSNRPKFYPERIRGKYSEASVKRYIWSGGLVRKIQNSAQRNLSRGKDTVIGAEDKKRKQHRLIEIDFAKGKLLPNVLIVSPDTGRRIKHPARFSLNLPRWACTLCTDPGDLVIDPMCGSGSTLIAAKETGRAFWGCDAGETYVIMSLTELERTEFRQASLFGEEFPVDVPAVEEMPCCKQTAMEFPRKGDKKNG